MLGKRRWLSVILVVALGTTGLTLSAAADAGTEAGFLSKINASRAAAGLAPLKVDSGLQTHARNHTADMIAAGEIYHSTSTELANAAGSGWSALAENVGRGGTVDSLHAAFMASPGHKANILGDYNYVGIGTGTGGGYLYVTVVFMRKGSTSTGSTPTTTSGGTTATTAAATTSSTTTTTLPPTTTTTLIVGPDHPVAPGHSCIETKGSWQLCRD
jgi:hypothetical protein